jgi:hypothetical protein
LYVLDVCNTHSIFTIRLDKSSVAHLLTLHHDNGDQKIVEVRAGKFVQDWKKGRKILIVVWGDLAGEYGLDLQLNDLFQFTPGGGIKRMSLRWHAVDVKQAWRLWYQLTEHGRSLNERSRKKV